MITLLPSVEHVLGTALAMAWEVAWSLVLGFVLAGIIQVTVSRDAMLNQLGGEGLGPIVRAAAYGAASSSCSYASAAITKSLLARGAGFIPSLAFLFASTNLVIELGIVLWRLMGWQFAAAEWLGGLVLITVMSALVRLTYPRTLIAQARLTAETASVGHDHAADTAPGANFLQRLRAPETRILVARSVAMDWSMLRGDLLLGFVIAGGLATLVPDTAWHHLFSTQPDSLRQSAADAAIAPLVAIVSFVCSIGNVPLAAALWKGGVDIGGVIAFLYSDLIVLPLLDVYRKSFGWKMAAYIGVIFYATMAISGFVVGRLFLLWHLTPATRTSVGIADAFQVDATFWLNLAALLVVIAVVMINRRNPSLHHACHAHHS